jgi:hypothetical protein
LSERTLQEDELARFERSGFVLVRGFLSLERIREVRQGLAGLTHRDGEQQDDRFYYEPSRIDPDRSLLRRIERPSELSKPTAALARSEELLAACTQLLGEPALLFKDKLNLKQAGGAGFPLHVDGHFWWTDDSGQRRRGWLEYASGFVSAVVFLDSATAENGPFRVCPLEESSKVLGGSFEERIAHVTSDIAEIRADTAAQLPMQEIHAGPGDVLFFDWRVPHGSAANLSASERPLMIFTYNGSSAGDCRERYYAGKSTSLGPRSKKSVLPATPHSRQ